MNLALRGALAGAAALAALAVPAAADESWTFQVNGTSDYRLTAVSNTSIFAGALPANDPTMNLVVGTRYAATVVNGSSHPLNIIARGASAGQDVVLLAMGGTTGSFESDVGVGFTDSAGVIAFTLTQALATAMAQGGRTPGYRCGVHTTTMRGFFAVTQPPPDATGDVWMMF